MTISARVRLLAGMLFALAVPSLSAQVPVDFAPGSAELSREDLQRLLQRYEEAVNSPAYSGRVKDAARADAQRIRERLQNGDFKVGDRVVLSVQGETNLPDTLVVEPGPQITLPLFGSISLGGVLRSELESHLTEELGKVIHDPVVHAQGLMRLSVQGSVGRPGFYVVPADVLVSDALMIAGGPTGEADLKDLRIDRGSNHIVEGPQMQQALLSGFTLDQLNLQAGDQLFLPARGNSPWRGILTYGLPILTTLTLIIYRVR